MMLTCAPFLEGAPLHSMERNDIMFRQLSTSQGLLNNNVTALCRDSRGFLWIGTASGLNRYDSYTFQQYQQDGDSLPDNSISDLFEDHTGNVWIATSRGYAIYDYRTGRFSQDTSSALRQLSVACDTLINAGTGFKKRYLWAHDDTKIYLHDHGRGMTKIYPLLEASVTKIFVTAEFVYSIYNSGRVYRTNVSSSLTQRIAIPERYDNLIARHSPRVYVDSNDGIWIYTFENSLLLYKKNMQTEWEEVRLPVRAEQFNRIRDIAEDDSGNIWIITSHLGGFIYQPAAGTLTNFTNDPLRSHTIASNNLNAIHIDREGIVWIGNFKHGISYYAPHSQVFLNQRFEGETSDILAFCEDSLDLWYGTDGGGLMGQRRGEPMPRQVGTPANVIVTIRKDSRGRLWLGSFQNGLISYDRGKIRQYTIGNSGLMGNDVYGIQEDKDGHIWIGTLNGCVQRLDVEKGEFHTVLDMRDKINISELLWGNDETLYAATSRGLMAIDVNNSQCRFVRQNAGGTRPIKSQHLYTLYKDSRDMLWMGGTQGLTCWDLATDSVTYIDQAGGLPTNLVTAIHEDNNKQIWVGTCNGIVRINLAQEPLSITRYDVTYASTANSVNERSIYRLRNGNILVGSPDGYTTIVPQEIARDTYKGEIYLTGIVPQYEPLGRMLGGKSLECATEVVLRERIPFFQLQFSTLDFVEPGKVTYAYRLKGRQSDWSYTTQNQIDFSILAPGTYELQVRARNSGQVWSPHVKTIAIKILPPWYRTPWAYLAYFVAALLIAWKNIAYFRSRRRRMAMLKSAKEENERQQKITDMKMQFFANVSHELRTPLSLIINPLEEFMAKFPQYKDTLLYTAHNNARYLLELINQLLDFRKLDAQGETMRYMHGDIVSVVRDQYQAFDSIARKREISYSLVCPQPDIQMDFDHNKVRKIVMNMLSNAFKFTKNKGSIEIRINAAGGNVVMQFRDTGCGVDAKLQEKIFQCFYQVEDQENSQGGSGIGLYLVAEYVKMHKGNIQVAPNVPQGSVFIITLPMQAASPRRVEEEERTAADGGEEGRQLGYAILLVDDNYDFLDFLSASLSTSYNVLKATNGREALEVLKGENVDIVVSDIMMPEMDGLELCAAIKSDINISHIPIILLTARASEEYQLKGLNVDADDYITKPFSMEVLKLRVSKLIESSLKKHALFDEQVKIEPSRITITSLDRQFVEQAIQIVEDNINNAEFSVEELAAQLNISRGYLYKKMVKITGRTSIEFIRVIRMKRARQLLEESQLQVAEIAYQLGYNSPKIFTKHFKEEFNMRPSDFLRQQTEDKTGEKTEE
jgi:signal transduction histidine kinase/DNA-binding response OmpR family regulator/streptogramin lyase